MEGKKLNELTNVLNKSLTNARIIGNMLVDNEETLEKIFSSTDLDMGFLTGIVDSIKISPDFKLSLKFCLALIQFGVQYKITKNLLESYNSTLGKVGCPSIAQAVGGVVTLFRDSPHNDKKYSNIDEKELLYFTNHLEKLIS